VGLGGDRSTAANMFSEARHITEQLHNDRALAHVLHLETANHLGYAEFAEGVETGLRAAEVFEAEGALWELASVLAFAGYLAGTELHHRQAASLGSRAGPLAERLGHLGALWLTVADRVRTEAILPGDLTRLEAMGREELTICERGQLPWICVARFHMGLAAFWKGDWGAAERELRLAAELEPPGVFGGGQFWAQLAVYLAHAGEAAEVGRIFEEHRAQLPKPDLPNGLGNWNALFAFTEALYLTGSKDEAAALLPLIAQALDQGREWIALDSRLIHTRAGIAAAAAGRWDEAEEYYRAALDVAAAQPSRIEQADVRRLTAQMLLDRSGPGDSRRASELLRQSIDTYRELGMPRFEAMTQALLARAS
jgi:tetratricopeptide (TPR) repeat protein